MSSPEETETAEGFLRQRTTFFYKVVLNKGMSPHRKRVTNSKHKNIDLIAAQRSGTTASIYSSTITMSFRNYKFVLYSITLYSPELSVVESVF